jgi:hypothetical protein
MYRQRAGRKLLFAVAGDDHDRLHATLRTTHVTAKAPALQARFALLDGQVFDVELEAVEHVEQIVGKVDVGLVHLVDQHHAGPALLDGATKGLQADVGVDTAGGEVVRVLGVLQAAQRVEAVEQVCGLAGALHGHRHHLAELQFLGDGAGQARLAASGLTLDEQRAAQVDRQIDDIGGLR